MTKFMNIPNPSNSEDKKKQFKPTVFTHAIDDDKSLAKTNYTASDFDFVIWLGYDSQYGDVFKAWNENCNYFTIYFGVKGDEDYL